MEMMIFTGNRMVCGLLLVFLSGSYAGAQNRSKEARWKEIETLIEDGLPQSALVEIDAAYRSALAEKNYGRLLKAVKFRTLCQQMTEEQPDAAIIESLLQDAEKVDEPAKSVIHSLVGEAYRNYYFRHLWRLDITSVFGQAAEGDIATWSAERIISETCRYLLLSLAQDRLLQRTPAGIFGEVLQGDAATRPLRATLYDLLAHRAIDILNDPGILNRDFSTFLVNREEYFADAEGYSKTVFACADTLAPACCIMNIFRRLTVFRLKQKDINALGDLDLKRFRFVRERGVFADADTEMMYEKALKYLLETCEGSKIWEKAAAALAAWYREEGERWKQTSDPKYRYRLVDAVHLYTELLREKITSKEEKAYAETLLNGLKQKHLSVEMQQEQMPCKPILAMLGYRNMSEVCVTVFETAGAAPEQMSVKEARDYFSRRKKISQQRLTLPQQSDYQLHNVEVRLDSLATGHYILVFSDLPDLSDTTMAAMSYAGVQVSDLFLSRRTAGRGWVEAYVTGRENGMPVENAVVKVFRRVYLPEESAFSELPDTVVRTDSLGQAFYRVAAGNRTVCVVHDGDSLVSAAAYDYPEPAGEDTFRTALFTDRAIYRPGQTVYFKGIIYGEKNGNSKLCPQMPVRVRLTDAGGKEVQEQDYVTSDFGSFHGSFVLPATLPSGRTTLQTRYGAVGFSVEEYKRATFEVAVQPVKGNCALGDSVKITGEAKAMAGYPIDEALVKWEVRRYAAYHPLRYRYSRSFPPLQQRQRLIDSGTAKTDKDGRFSLNFKAEDEDIRDKKQIYIYDIKIDVTDPNGETQSASQSIRLSGIPFLLDIKIPENIFIGADSLQYRLNAVNPNMEPVAADIRIELYALPAPKRILRNRLWQDTDTVALSREQFVACFPFDAYGDENHRQKQPEKTLKASWDTDTRSGKQTDLSRMASLPSGRYMLKFDARNEGGKVMDSIFITLQHKDSSLFEMNRWLTEKETQAYPGDSVTFWLAGGKDQSYIRYDVLYGDSVAEQKIVTTGRVPQMIRIPVKEAYRSGFAVQFLMVQENRSYHKLCTVEVPYDNKKLDIAFQSFRSHLLPGEKEKWTLTVKNRQGKNETAEMAAVLYDASLDLFTPHLWQHSFYRTYRYSRYTWTSSHDSYHAVPLIYKPFLKASPERDYENLEVIENRQQAVMMKSRRTGSKASEFDLNEESLYGSSLEVPSPSSGSPSPETLPLSEIPLRTRFFETAFFHPALRTNEKGEISVEFTLPDVLTRWKMLGFAHTGDLKTGSTVQHLITRKQIAVSANLPRFFRQGDEMILTAKVNNHTDEEQKINVMLRFYDAFTMQPADARILKSPAMQQIAAGKEQSAVVQWTLAIPDDMQALTYRLTAQTGNHSDGEERSVPILSKKTAITETMPFIVRGDGLAQLHFDKLAGSTAMSTIQQRRLTLEYTSQPVWYAIQALTALMEKSAESTEQLFTRFYANSLSVNIINTLPSIRKTFDKWRAIPENKTPQSQLEKNQDLKQALLRETPWVVQADNETERRKRTACLFDRELMEKERQKAWTQLLRLQGANGGFPWFPGQPEDRSLTQYIVSGLEHMRHLNALPRMEEINDVIEKALNFCDAKIDEDYRKKSEDKSVKSMKINSLQLQYLYLCSFSQRRPYAIPEAFDFYMKQAEEYWARFSLFEQALTAILMYRYGKPDIAQNILRSLKEKAQVSDETGMYWAENRRGRFWNESPIETQAMLIEAFGEVGSDTKAVEEMKLWLLRNRQVNDWKTPKATVAAVYALLRDNDDEMPATNLLPIDIRIGGKPLKKAVKEPINPEPGTGYFSTSWFGKDITASMADLRIANLTDNVVWGTLYWQYFEESDKVTPAETQLKVSKQLLSKQNTVAGKALLPIGRLKKGDIVTVRLEVRADTDFEYVHLKDGRATGFEPVNAISEYRYRNGLGYYETCKDASVNFFIQYLPKGVWIFEYDVIVTHEGVFSNGIATVQCMYAPEYNAHSNDIRIEIHE
ncbi:MAG: hypothetical protein LBS03_09950 [Bacteroidales bacterium]|nr:hypothetical protein [Bacteroidales bacterium]